MWVEKSTHFNPKEEHQHNVYVNIALNKCVLHFAPFTRESTHMHTQNAWEVKQKLLILNTITMFYCLFSCVLLMLLHFTE